MLPSVDQIAKALGPIVKKGLPVYPEFADETLLGLPSVLNRSHDPEDRLSRVKALDELLREHLDQYPDDALLEVAGILLGAKTGSRRQPIGERRKAAARRLGVGTEHMRTGIQPKILMTLAWELHRDSQDAMRSITQPSSLAQVGASVPGASSDRVPTAEGAAELSPEAHREARQLYWWTQETLVCVESFALASRFIENLNPGGEFYTAARRLISSRTNESDKTLWALAHCFEYLRVLERDDSGRDFLRELLPPEWKQGAMYVPFHEYDAGAIRGVLAEVSVDEARPFVEDLLRSDFGPSAYARWLEVLGASPVDDADSKGPMIEGRARNLMQTTLVEVARCLEDVFPADARHLTYWQEPMAIELAFFGLMHQGMRLDSGKDDELIRALRAVDPEHLLTTGGSSPVPGV